MFHGASQPQAFADDWRMYARSLLNDTENIAMVEEHCSELLIHAADVEGLCQGIDEDLVKRLGEWVNLPCTYAGGAKGV